MHYSLPMLFDLASPIHSVIWRGMSLNLGSFDFFFLDRLGMLGMMSTCREGGEDGVLYREGGRKVT